MKKLLALLMAVLMVLSASAALGESLLPLKEPVKITMAITQNANVSDYENNYFTKWLEEKTGIDLELILYPSADAATKLNMAVASGDKLPDIISFGVDANTAYEWGSEGVLLPWNEWFKTKGQGFYDFCASIGLDGDRDVLSQITSIDGNIYAAPFFSYSYNNLVAPARVWINQTWLDKLNLKAPTTYEELITVLTAFRDQDPNGNGMADEIPMLGDNALSWLQNMWIYRNNNDKTPYLPLSETDGVLDVYYDKDAYRDYLIYANKLVADGLLSPLSFTMDTNQFNALVQAETSQIGIIANSSAPTQFTKVADKYAAVEQPVGPNGARYTSLQPGTAYPRMAVTCDCENPDIAMDLVMFQFTEAGSDLAMVQRYGEKGVNWRLYDPAVDTNLVGALPGMDPYVVQLEQAWGTMTDKLWQVQIFGYVSDPAWWVAGIDPNDPNPTANYYFGKGYELNRKYGPDFADLVTVNSFAYTDEEQETWVDARTALISYVNEARTLFAMGEMNPADDAAWNSYLNELNNLKYKDIIAVDNAAYARKVEMMK